MVYRKSIFERNGRYKFLHLTTDDRPFASLVESAESESILDMSRTVIQIFPATGVRDPTGQDYLSERVRLEREGWKFCVEAFDELPVGFASWMTGCAVNCAWRTAGFVANEEIGYEGTT
jgi:hypothetical protein